MIKLLFKNIYYFFYDVLKIFLNFKKDKQFIILLPRIFFKIFNKVIIFDKKNKSFFFQHIRNRYDLLTIYEIFGEQDYNINKFIEKYELGITNDLSSKLIIDCGSNIGSSIEFFSRIYPNSRIIGLEPEINNFNFLKKNITFKNYLTLNKAISSEEKELKLNVNQIDNRSFNITEDNGTDVKSITVENIIKNYSKDYKPFLIKIDIEGYESKLFKKNFEWIDDFEIIIIEIHDWMLPGQSNSFNFIRALTSVNNKRDLILSGENLVSIKINDKK